MVILAEGDYGPRSLIEYRLTQLGFPASFVWTWRSVGFISLFLVFLASSAMITGDGDSSMVGLFPSFLRFADLSGVRLAARILSLAEIPWLVLQTCSALVTIIR